MWKFNTTLYSCFFKLFIIGGKELTLHFMHVHQQHFFKSGYYEITVNQCRTCSYNRQHTNHNTCKQLQPGYHYLLPGQSLAIGTSFDSRSSSCSTPSLVLQPECPSYPGHRSRALLKLVNHLDLLVPFTGCTTLCQKGRPNGIPA